MTPVLDGAENIALAEKIYQGTLPPEPFYRAMLYPLMLALLRYIGVEPHSMMAAAGMLGMLFHVFTALLVARIAYILWRKEATALLAGILYGFYPLAVYFAADPVDITAAIFFLTLGLYLYLHNWSQGSAWQGAVSGLAIGIGGLLRANVLAAAGVFFVDIFIAGQKRQAIPALLAVVAMVALGGLVGWWHSGEFRLMPWQGSFVLYTANSADANGRYFNQTMFLPDRDLGYNPARLESEIIYRSETGAGETYDIDDFNRFWREKTMRHIVEQPLAWLGLSLRKLYYLFNNFEQYNNKTFFFHRDMSPWLRYNPLGWGILLIAAGMVLATLSTMNFAFRRVLLTFCLLAAGTVVFLVSARFRFLLVPLLVVMAAGVIQVRVFASQNFRKSLLVALIVALISFSSLWGAADKSTINSDRMLLAHACARLFDFEGQVFWSDKVLQEFPEHLFAIRVKIAGFTNLVLSGRKGDKSDWQLVSRELSWLANRDLLFPDTAFLSGCYAFKVVRDYDRARQIWEHGLKSYPEKDLYLGALVYAGFKNLTTLLNSPPGSIIWYLKIRDGLQPNDNPELFAQMQRATSFLF